MTRFIKLFNLSRLYSRRFIFVIAGLVIIAALPLIIGSEYVISEVLAPMLIFAIYASSWNLLAFSGQGSLGHAAFLGIGGFTSALLAIKLGVPPLLGLFLGGLFSAAIGFLIGLTCVRLKAWFLGMVTFGFSVISLTLVSQFDSVIGGIMGFRTPLIVPRGVLFYYFTFAVAAASIFIIYLIMKSKLGLAFKAIRENELEAKMTGINTARYRLVAFILSTFFAGLAGGLYAQYIRYIDVSIFSPHFSFLPLMMAVIGGLGTLSGPLIGSAIIVSIDAYLPRIDHLLQGLLGSLFPAVSNVGPPIRMMLLGIILLVVVIFAPKGIYSVIDKAYAHLLNKRAAGKQ
ncbi:MAG: branched-chain amino acid ABC transporter permease [Candidatus Bathyarchaeota archaeon]|nr:branched-chain amino acid ABC transporter permease [Candidatus Bathyarchaeota archaeon]